MKLSQIIANGIKKMTANRMRKKYKKLHVHLGKKWILGGAMWRGYMLSIRP